MAWQDIGAGEVDANSPVSTTLMAKLRNNLYWLFSNATLITLFNNTDEPEPSAGCQIQNADTYESVKEVKVFVPANTKTLKVRVRAKITGAGTRKMRAAEDSTFSDEHAFSGANYEEFDLTITDPTPGFYGLQIQAKAPWASSVYLHWLLAYVAESK